MGDVVRLSELVRQGAASRPQCFYHYFSPSGGSCALGAAMEALTGSTNLRRGMKALQGRFPALFTMDNLLSRPIPSPEMPSCERRHLGLSGLVTHLNNEHHRPREWIADWLGSLGL
jgi:hypothetical protein